MEKGCMMEEKSRLMGKRVLIVDDEMDVLETLAELLSMCTVTKASSFNEA
jgi:hypoxanthine-guanine phosphoribosyltransferase